MKAKNKAILTAAFLLFLPSALYSQSEIYPQHFNLEEVKITDGPFKQSLETNNRLLLQYDTDRLLTPFIRQAGLSADASSKYYNWTEKHPTFENWGLSSWSLEGHAGGHYLTALSLAYAATPDANTKEQLKQRIDYMLEVLNDCQRAFDTDTKGMKGFLGGQPLNQIWTGLYAKNLEPFKQFGGWVPFYCQHKVLAGLRDAWLYTDSELAKELFRNMCDWSILVVSNLTESQMQDILGWEHGGMNETLADAYKLFGEQKYLDAARKYSHQSMVNGLQQANATFLDGKHANTQVPKYIGFERIFQEGNETRYKNAAHNFWNDVAQNRTVCIGGNSVSEHFLAASNSHAYIDNLDGPESCNSNNMLKLSEMLFDESHDARYADFYEATTWNHILSTQDPQTGGYVYFTSLRPQSYRIYSTVNESMWCCVGTGMENHSKYSHFAYTHSEDNKTLYVNLFVPSKLDSDNFGLTQTTEFPYAESTKLTVDKAGSFTLAIRHPAWTTADYAISINGQPQEINVTKGKASHVSISREWKQGDVVEVQLPMELRMEQCPNYKDFIAFKYGPILLAAPTAVGESLPNEYGHEGRMDHAPGVMAKALPISSSPLLIGERNKVTELITKTDKPLTFSINVTNEQNEGKWDELQLVPFFQIHHARYTCYWYQNTSEGYQESDMGKAEAEEARLTKRTIDFVAPGEQQSEAGHDALYENSTSGTYRNEFYRDCKEQGFVQYTLENKNLETDSICLMLRFTTADHGRTAKITIDGKTLKTLTIPTTAKGADANGFYNIEYPIPTSMLLDKNGEVKPRLTFRIAPNGTNLAPGLYFLRLMNGYNSNTYVFVAKDWITGDEGRVPQNKITYNSEDNTLTVDAGTGANNVALAMDFQNTDYNVPLSHKLLVVKGNGLKTGKTDSYLWWLNGTNKASQVAPTTILSTPNQETIVAWDITKSGLNANCTSDPWNASIGATIFGLTSSTGSSTISYIGFVASVDDIPTAIEAPSVEHNSNTQKFYNLQGQYLGTKTPRHGIYVTGNKKIAITPL